MKRTVVIEYDEKDYELIRNLRNVPKNPCLKCGLKGNGCCGCPDGATYANFWKPYEEAGIEDIAKKILERNCIREEIYHLQSKFDSITSEIPSVFLAD